MAVSLDLGNLLIHLKLDLAQYEAMMKKVERQLTVTSKRMTQIGRDLSFRVTLPIAAIGAASTKAFADFDDAMTKSLAIMQGITPDLRREMEGLALSISTDGVTSATDLARSYFFLASAGLDAQQSLAALGAVEKFAVAGAFDMALATDLATDAQSALGLTVKDAQQNLVNLTRVTDVLVGANTLANATVQQFSTALTSQAGPAMKAYGVSLEEGVSVLAAFADQGIKAERAGNLFSRMLRLMTKGFQDNEQAWKRFNINIFDANKELRPMHDIVRDLSEVLENMSTKQKIATLDMLGFQARSQQAILPLIGLQDRIEEYNRRLEQMGGMTREVAERNMKSFSAQLTTLKNQLTAVGIGIGEILAPRLLEVNEAIQRGLKRWNELSLATRTMFVDLALLTAAIGPLLIVMGSLLKLIVALKVASLLATKSVSALSMSLTVLFGAISGFAIGTFLFNEFKLVREIGMTTIKALEKGWVHLEFAFRQAIAHIRIAWDKFSTGLQRDVITLRAGLPLALGGITEATARHLKLAINENSQGTAILEENSKRLKAQLAEIDQSYIDLAASMEKAFAAAKEGTETGTILDTSQLEQAKKILEDIGVLIDSWGDKFGSFGKVMDDWHSNATDIGKNVGEVFTSAFNRMSTELADFLTEGKANFSDFAKSVMKDLLAIAIRAQIVAPLAKALGFTTTVPTPTNVQAGVAHSGGIVGQLSSTRMVPVSVFSGAQRFHNGGIAGLRSNEVPIIAERGERILPEGASGMPGIIVNINNQTGKQMDASRQDVSFNGREFVVDVVVQDFHSGGPVRSLFSS
jgi:TP901 family phage tail tape measure protein